MAGGLGLSCEEKESIKKKVSLPGMNPNGGKAGTVFIPVDNTNCSTTFNIVDPKKQLRVFIQTTDCKTCAARQCGDSRTCSIHFDRNDAFLKKMYQVCIDVSNLKFEDCSTSVEIDTAETSFATIFFCSIPMLKTLHCSASVSMTLTSPNFCRTTGHALFYMRPHPDYAGAYDLTDMAKCGERMSGFREITSSSPFKIMSWYSSASGAKPSFCKFTLGIPNEVEKFCFKFTHAYFPIGGASLSVEMKSNVFNRDIKKYEYSRRRMPLVGFEVCYNYLSFNSYFHVYLIPFPEYPHVVGSASYDHAFILIINFRFSERYENNNNSDTGQSVERDMELQKKVIIAVAVFCVAIFVCFYYACTKSRQRGLQQPAASDGGHQVNTIRAPYIEREPLTNVGNRELAPCAHPCQTIIGAPENRRTPSPFRQRTQTQISTSVGVDQPPPHYADLLPQPPPSSRRRRGSENGQTRTPIAPPPAYETLFPERT